MVIDMDKKKIREPFLADFMRVLQKEGMEFKSGYWDYEEETLEEILAWNTEMLMEDEESGMGEKHSRNYKQICFDYHGFSEVRLFIINSGGSDYFNIYLIIPEDDLLTWTKGRVSYDMSSIRDLEKLACQIWSMEAVEVIQTELEITEEYASPEEIAAGREPSMLPFAIMHEKYFRYRSDVWGNEGTGESGEKKCIRDVSDVDEGRKKDNDGEYEPDGSGKDRGGKCMRIERDGVLLERLS